MGPAPVGTYLWLSHLSRCSCGFHSRRVPSVTGSSCQFPNSRELGVMAPPLPLSCNSAESAQICMIWLWFGFCYLGIKGVILGQTLCLQGSGNSRVEGPVSGEASFLVYSCFSLLFDDGQKFSPNFRLFYPLPSLILWLLPPFPHKFHNFNPFSSKMLGFKHFPPNFAHLPPDLRGFPFLWTFPRNFRFFALIMSKIWWFSPPF